MFTIAHTDNDWFKFLKEEQLVNDINFWTPTPWNLKSINKGDKFYFMLKSPIRKIGGGGYFQSYKNLSIKEAWSTYGKRNGFSNKQDFIDILNKHRKKNSIQPQIGEATEIGVIILNDVVFLDEEDYIDLKEHKEISFPNSIVKTKNFPHEEDTLKNSVFGTGYDPEIIKFKPLSPNTPKTPNPATTTASISSFLTFSITAR